MEGVNYLTVGLGLLGFIVNIIVLVIVGTWQLSKVRNDIAAQVVNNREAIHQEVDVLRREVGEGMTALRQKITDVELWSRDTFVRRESFFELMRRSETLMEVRFKAIDTQFEKFDVRFGKVDDKLTALVQRQAV